MENLNMHKFFVVVGVIALVGLGVVYAQQSYQDPVNDGVATNEVAAQSECSGCTGESCCSEAAVAKVAMMVSGMFGK